GMIRITQQESAKDAKRYYATADYYSEGQEIVGCWGGQGASRLGLEGTVDKLSFERLCDNLDPSTGKPLTVRTRSEWTLGCPSRRSSSRRRTLKASGLPTPSGRGSRPKES